MENANGTKSSKINGNFQTTIAKCGVEMRLACVHNAKLFPPIFVVLLSSKIYEVSNQKEKERSKAFVFVGVVCLEVKFD